MKDGSDCARRHAHNSDKKEKKITTNAALAADVTDMNIGIDRKLRRMDGHTEEVYKFLQRCSATKKRRLSPYAKK